MEKPGGNRMVPNTSVDVVRRSRHRSGEKSDLTVWGRWRKVGAKSLVPFMPWKTLRWLGFDRPTPSDMPLSPLEIVGDSHKLDSLQLLLQVIRPPSQSLRCIIFTAAIQQLSKLCNCDGLASSSYQVTGREDGRLSAEGPPSPHLGSLLPVVERPGSLDNGTKEASAWRSCLWRTA